jgi:hypothetical protein
MASNSLKSLRWDHRFVAIFKCSPRFDPTIGKSVEELVVANSAEIENDPNLERVLRMLRSDLIFKRLYRDAEKPTTRPLAFQSCHEGQDDVGHEKLVSLLKATSLDEVRSLTLELAKRYITIPNIREGVLIFLLAQGKADVGIEGQFVFVFKCDFERVSQITQSEVFRKIEEAIVEETKKGAIYPYFDRGRFDNQRVRVFDQLGDTQYWLRFLNLVETKPRSMTLGEAILDKLGAEHPELSEKYGEGFKELLPKRPLSDDDRLVAAADRLSVTDVQELSTSLVAALGDFKIKLQLGSIEVIAPLSNYLNNWVLAENGDERYILIRGSTIENCTPVVYPVDLTDLPSLREAAAILQLDFTEDGDK